MKEEEKEIEPEAKIEEDDENFDNEPVIEKPKDVFIRWFIKFYFLYYLTFLLTYII